MSANDAATSYGWYQISGKAIGRCLTAFADNGLVFATASVGLIDDTSVAGDLVKQIARVPHPKAAGIDAEKTRENFTASPLPADGKILVGGDFGLFNSIPAQRIVRLNPNGSVDTNFNMAVGAPRAGASSAKRPRV